MPSANTEDLRRKFLVVQQQRSAPPNLAGDNLPSAIPNAGVNSATTSLMMTTSTGLGGVSMGAGEPERTYVFPGGNPVVGSAPGGGQGIPGVAMAAPSRGHARSISHGGGAIVGANGRPIKSAMKGHQRAFSQGQITDSPPGSAAPAGRGHSRVGSKTDFILPPGHKEEPAREPSAPTSAAGGRGHSRQASRSESIYTLRRTEAPPWWKRLSLCNYNTADKLEERSYRMVVPNHTVPPKTPKRDHPNGQFVGNKIRTTKYTLLSFIPKNLLEQFHRVANLYFIFIVLLNWVPEISAFGKEVAMIPVLFVLGVTAVKDLFEDRRRRASDKRINNTTCRVYDGETERYKKVKWQDLRVGDIVHLSNNETVPADILLLRTSDPQGVCYIDTCDLDGETNLKRREVVRGFEEMQSIFVPSKFVSRVEADAPTTKLYRFHGALIHPTGERVPISTECLLLRESRLKNTDYIEGIVVYAGHETKSMLNNSGPRYKRSQVEQQMNIDVIWCVIILLILCVVGAVGCRMWLSSFTQFPVPYLPPNKLTANMESMWIFWTYIVILQVMIPLSLYVTIELCKILQVFHIHNNVDLYDQETNKQTECRAMNITEELGQIQHIFTDKTGTLTENKMIFRRCVVNGSDYNHPPSELEKIYSKPGAPAPPLIPNDNLSNDMAQSSQGVYLTPHAQRIQEFLVVLAICNTVIVGAAPHRDLMNASGIIEVQQIGNSPANLKHGKQRQKLLATSTTTTRTTILNGPASPQQAVSIPADRYIRLAESRSVTPSPPPNLLFALPAQSHQPTLSPISSSAESSPNSESESPSPPMKNKALSNSISPTGRAKAVINSKITSIATFLNAKTQGKRLKLPSSKTETIYRTADGRPLYEAESPDELALVNAAYSYDCCLLNRSANQILVSMPTTGAPREYEILKVLPFDSSRKCMSIVVRQIGTQEIVLYTKGADSSIMPVLVPCSHNSPEGILREQTQQQLDRYAREGLRILVMAKRTLNSADYTDWWARHQEIEMSLENRERRLRDSFAKLESNLTLLGATGIEDRLQDGVPETIASLLSAGISVWVLTGDKPETAINIAYSAKLFTQQMELIRLTARSRDAAETAINFYLTDMENDKATSSLGYGQTLRKKQRALVVDGKTLTFILDQKSKLIMPFLRLSKRCASVLCCRSTPLQKAYLVKVVKEELNLRTLAIGDGANDVSMIQMADVGVGISGQEGMQAVMAADFTLPRFRYLERLLLAHGYWCYDRLSRMILYFFYKNAAFVFLIFWYQLYCGFSGQVMMDQMYLMLYNLIFTSLPPLAIGVYDKRVPEDLLLKNPYLYKNGRLGVAYRPHDFWLILLDSLYQSLVIFFVALCAYAESDVGIWEFGTTITASCLFANLVHCAIEIRSWTVLHVLSIVISLGSFYLFSIVYDSMCLNCFGVRSSYWVIFVCFASAVHWLVILLSTVVAVLPRLLLTTVRISLCPDDSTKVILQSKRERSRGEGLLVTWSRSTSASSIYRITDYGSKNQIITTIT
ncbi:phospholipid-transporting ATPase VD isoform X1 [Drosophila biarmipes]|uniref:phospholipid-transporting ATPase VD isoform X1 n=1 Tax=Drosophila biarmipes TaxID=125945 RepID=UPI0007E6AE5D|nr:phospholipid-transporting ATPase VD isoform X1 [Drosophila biarmipes]XP_016962032.1 phospholipid-transporting ATPase VD isoform X1 [Drosophila biarmipes]XP_016962033.1 phospholipid-transporting ATPase VD isoform X1 [Drosophila biarmipes]XP_016962034.1 phospholipid-transporting ATPase VD isoform X1 [Drosophila biarmipes]